MSSAEFDPFTSITQQLELEPLIPTYADGNVPLRAVFRRDGIVKRTDAGIGTFMAKASRVTFDAAHLEMFLPRHEVYAALYAAHLILTREVDEVTMTTVPARTSDETYKPINTTYDITPYVASARHRFSTGQLEDHIYDAFNQGVLEASAGLTIEGSDLRELTPSQILVAGHAAERFMVDYRDLLI
jgi:hypothetical protein